MIATKMENANPSWHERLAHDRRGMSVSLMMSVESGQRSRAGRPCHCRHPGG